MAEKKTEQKNPWKEMKPITLPKAAKGEDKFVYVRVNDRTFQIPKGKMTTVPLPVYERLMITQEAEDRADRYAEAVEGEHKLG